MPVTDSVLFGVGLAITPGLAFGEFNGVVQANFLACTFTAEGTSATLRVTIKSDSPSIQNYPVAGTNPVTILLPSTYDAFEVIVDPSSVVFSNGVTSNLLRVEAHKLA